MTEFIIFFYLDKWTSFMGMLCDMIATSFFVNLSQTTHPLLVQNRPFRTTALGNNSHHLHRSSIIPLPLQIPPCWFQRAELPIPNKGRRPSVIRQLRVIAECRDPESERRLRDGWEDVQSSVDSISSSVELHQK